MAIKCGYCKEHHASIDQVKECAKAAHPSSLTTAFPAQHKAVGRNAATEKQVNFLRTLLSDRPSQEAAYPHPESLSKAQASEAITKLKGMPKENKTSHHPEPANKLDDGTYFYEGTYYRIVKAVHGSGKQYAKRLHVHGKDEEGKWQFSWEYEGRKPLGFLTADHRLTAEQAKAFGLEYGVCVRCARTLTKEESIYVGYGSTCAGHEGWWYPTKSELAELTATAAP